MIASYYRAGTLSVVAGATAVALVGAAALSQVRPGDSLVINGTVAVIDVVTDNLNLVLADGWPGSTVTASSDWLILRTSAEWFSNVPISSKLSQIIGAIEAGLQVSGALAISYTFSTTTADADPGAGILRLGSATQNAATVIRADLANANGVDVSGILAEAAASASGTKSHVRLFHALDPTRWIAFGVTAMASPTGYRNLTVVPVSASEAAPFLDGDPLMMIITRNGDIGALTDHTVTNAKLAQVAQYSVKIRYTAGTGDYQDVLLGAGLKVDATSFRIDWGGNFPITNTDDATSTTTGALSVAGGASFLKSLRISANGSSTAAPRVVSIEDLSAAEAGFFQFGGADNSLGFAYGGRLYLQSYSGLVLGGGRAGTPMALDTSGAGASDASVQIVGNGTGNALEIKDTAAGSVVAGFDKTGILKNGGMSRVASSNFSKTSDTTLAAITGLGEVVQAGKTYKFKATLFVTCGTTGGHKYAIGGTATATAIVYHILSEASGATANAISSQQTALNGSAGQAGSAAYLTTIEGTITVNAAGTIVPTFAQNASNGTASNVLVGSTFEVQEIT